MYLFVHWALGTAACIYNSQIDFSRFQALHFSALTFLLLLVAMARPLQKKVIYRLLIEIVKKVFFFTSILFLYGSEKKHF